MRRPTRELESMVRVALASVVALLALGGWWLVPGPVSAAAQGTTCTGYAPTPLSVVPTTVGPGVEVTATGVALPNAKVTLSLRRPDATVVVLTDGTAASTGAFSITATLPADLVAGHYELIATSPGCPVPFTVVLTVPEVPGATTTTTSTVEATSTTVGGGGTDSTLPTETSLRPSVQDAGSDVLGLTETRAAAPESTPASATGALAFTGGEVRPYVVVAIVVIAVGALLLGTSRGKATSSSAERRRPSDADRVTPTV